MGSVQRKGGCEVARKRVKRTRLDIIQCATTMFLEQGYTASTTKLIADTLDIASGNLNYYFPTKEHMLAELVDMLCDYQCVILEREAEEGYSSIMGLCLELTTMAAACETDDAARDFFTSAYTSPLCQTIIRKNDARRAKDVFQEYCPDWTDEQYAETELQVFGIEYATLMNAGNAVKLETRIAGALNTILWLYNIPEEIRKMKIRRVLDMDYRELGERVLKGFKQYVQDTNEQALEALYRAKGLQMP